MEKTVLKIRYDGLLAKDIKTINKRLGKPGMYLLQELGVPLKLGMRVAVALGANKLASVNLVCIPKDKAQRAFVRPFGSFPDSPGDYTYNTIIKTEKPIRVERMTIEEAEAIKYVRQNRSE